MPSSLSDERFSRLSLIPWWDQQRLRRARILVVGAGALGNEILKNLALLGVEQVVVIDLDCVEASNLSRSVLFSEATIGQPKCEVASAAYRRILPSATVQPLRANVLQEVGLGLFAWADLILAGLDNREARLFLNRAAWLVNRPWIDGAIEGINGVARVFLPGQPPCYECTLGAVDWAILERRMSCNLLAHRPDADGKVPTTPTISSIIAGIEVQEAVKLLHAMPTLAGQGFVFEGLNHSSYRVEYTENPDCLSHSVLDVLHPVDRTSDQITMHELWQLGCTHLHASAVTLDFSRDIILALECPACATSSPVYAPVGHLHYDDARCPACSGQRVVRTAHSYNGTESFGTLTPRQLGLPLFDVLTARTLDAQIGLLFAADAPIVLGPLAQNGDHCL